MMYGIQNWVDPIGVGKYRVTSGEGKRKAFKTNSGKMSSSDHLGIDMAAPKGTRVGSAMQGVVVNAGWINGYGNTVVVRAPDGTFVQYAHLDKINVSAGQPISAGEQLGTVGSTGNSTGNHLDLIVSRNGMAITRDGKPHMKTKSWLTDGGRQAASYRPVTPANDIKKAEIGLALDKLQSIQQQAGALNIAPPGIPDKTVREVSTALDSIQSAPVIAPTEVNPIPALDSLTLADTHTDPLKGLTSDTGESTGNWVAGLRRSFQSNQYDADRNAAINRLIAGSPEDDTPLYGTIPDSLNSYLETLVNKA